MQGVLFVLQKSFYKKTMFLGILIFSLSVFLSLPFPVLAIGISPAVTLVENIPQNAAIPQQIIISRGNPSQTQRAKIVIEGSVANYIEKTDGDSIELPQGKQMAPYTFTIKPGTLGEGTYEATITVYLAPSEKEPSQTSGAALVAGAQGKIRFSVTSSAVENYEIKNALMQETEEEQNVGFTYLLLNNGNVDSRPFKIELTFTDERDPTNIVQESLSGEAFPFVKAFSQGSASLQTKTTLKQGLYSAKFVFFNKQGGVIFTQERMRFQVWPRGSLAQKGELQSFTADKSIYQPGEQVKLSGVFKNTGEVGLSASLIVEIFYKQTRLDLLKKGPVFVPINTSAAMETFFRVQDRGPYTAKASVEFGPHKTNELEAPFKVSVSETSIWALWGVLVLAICLIAGIILWQRRKK